MPLFRRPRGTARATPARLRLELLEARETPAVTAGFAESVFAAGLTTPTAMAPAPDGRIFVAEKGGTLRVVQNGTVLATPFVTLDVNTFSERGLVGVAVDPNFATDHFVYVYYTTNAATPVNRVSRFTASGNVAAPGSELVLLDNIPSNNGNHNGGSLVFGADGKLYIGVGDSGVSSNAQDFTTLAGKVLRINPDGSIPADNPFLIPLSPPSVRREIWASGLRNPFTMAVQPGTGRLFINDVGQSAFEEIDEGVAGANYGWPQTEGFTPPGAAGVTYPVYAYAHGTGPLEGDSIAGGAFYNPTTGSFPLSFVGDYFFGDFVNSRIFVRDAGTGAVSQFASTTAGTGIVDLDVLPDGRLLYLSLNVGAIYQITYAPLSIESGVVAVGTGGGTPSQVAVLYPNGSTRLSLDAYPGYTGGVRVATGDVTGDGVEDIVTGTAPGGAPHVKVFEGQTGGLVRSFFAFDPGFLGGVYVASGDVNGDNVADIVVSTATGSSHVKVFDGATGAEVMSFLAFPGFSGGVTVAAGDVDGDRFADIIVGTAVGSSHVKVFSGRTGFPLQSFLAFAGFTGGVTVGYAGGDVIAGTATATTHVKAFDANGALVQSLLAFPGFPGGVRVGGDGSTILAGAGPGAGPHLKEFDLGAGREDLSLFVFDPRTPGGIFVG